jgi:thymidylate kinase
MAGLAGVGKSTLAEGIGSTLRQCGHQVDVFGEEELFTRPQFARVADGFRTEQYASPTEFEAGYRAWLATLADQTIGVMDWNPAGMAGDLPWATGDRSRLRLHLRSVRRLAGRPTMILHLQAPAEITIERAGRQRGEEWLSRSDQIARAAGHRQRELRDRLIAEATRHAAQTREELSVAAEAGWPVQAIDATPGPGSVHDRAMALIQAAVTTRTADS